MLIPARTLDTMLFFSDRGKVYSEKVYQIPDADRADQGHPAGQRAGAWTPTKRVTAAIAVPGFRRRTDSACMATARGKIKRVDAGANSPLCVPRA